MAFNFFLFVDYEVYLRILVGFLPGARHAIVCDVVFEEGDSRIEHDNGNRTELVVQSNVYWLGAKFLDGKSTQQVVAPHGQCRYASRGLSRAD